MPFKLNYNELIHLDAEQLAEGGVAHKYESLLPELWKYVPQPLFIEDRLDEDTPCYSVQFGDREFVIFGPELNEDENNSWGNATFALFEIINQQLANSEFRFYAINSGNDLAGMFLTQSQALEAQKSIRNKKDWPYLPSDNYPWYGQYH